MKRLAKTLGTFIERRPVWLIAVATLLTVMATLGALQVEFRTSQDMLISRDSQTYRDYERYSRQFGGDQIVVLLSGSLDSLLSPSNLDAMARLHRELEADPRIKLVVSPLTFLNGAAQSAAAEKGGNAEALANDPQFIKSVTFGPDGRVSPQMAQVIPDGTHALIVVRLAGDLGLDEQKSVAVDVKQVVMREKFAATEVLAAGTPMLIRDLIDSMRHSMAVTGILAVVLMIVVLFVVFPARWRLLSIPLVLIGVLWTFGVMGFADMPITMVTMAGLPILIGLGVDYAIQFHNRYDEEILRGDSPAAAVIDAITHIGPAVGIAVFATALGFIVLLISEVPMIRDFGVMITIGVALLYVVGFFLLNAVLYQRDKKQPIAALQKPGSASGALLERLLSGLARRAIRYPLPIIVVATVLCGVGLYLDRQLPVQTDIEKLMPPSAPALGDLRRARQVVGGTTQISVLVEGEDLTRPAALSWIDGYQREELARHPELINAESITSALAAANGGGTPPADQVEQILSALPAPVRESVITPDRRAASINFGVKSIPFDQLDKLATELGADARPPTGVAATPASQLVLAARTSSVLTANRELIALAGLAAVALGLMVAYRSGRRALIAVLPIALVTGWSSGFMYLAGIDLNPLTAVLGSLIIGIGTEFTVLLLERYNEEKANGRSPLDAMLTGVSRVGPAITASGLTVVAGFGTLMASDFPMLRDFGRVIVVDVFLALGATLIILPAAVVWLDERAPSDATTFPAGARTLLRRLRRLG